MFERRSPVSFADIPPGDRAKPDGGEQVSAAEHVERQVAPAVVIAVEEAAFLMAVQGIVGGVEVEHDLFGRAAVRIEEERDEQALDCRRVMADPVIARGRARGAVLKPVEMGWTAPGIDVP
jgi:hypothetical protein